MRIRFLVEVMALILGATLSIGSALAAESLNPLTVETDSGWIRGQREAGTRAFKGVPYAEPPVGSLRWRAPQPVSKWKEIRNTTRFGSSCPQISDGMALEALAGLASPPSSPKIIGKEDCLSLNIWTPDVPKKEAGLPVMVFLHGGSNLYGSSAETVAGFNLYRGANLARRGHVVVVTLNYRLGTLGFFGHSDLSKESPDRISGNYGLQDQIAALKWVRKNIVNFNGDSSRVLLFGESAGGTDATSLATSPRAEGLFSRLISQSGAFPLTILNLKENEKRGQLFAEGLGCSNSNALSCLRGKDLNSLLLKPPVRGDFAPILDGKILIERPMDRIRAGHFHDLPVIVGSNDLELSYLWPAVAKSQGLTWPPRRLADLEKHILKFFTPEDARRIYSEYESTAKRQGPAKAEIELASDFFVVCPLNRIAKDFAAGKKRWVDSTVREYRFAKSFTSGALKDFGPAHAFELPFVFGNWPRFPYTLVLRPTPEDLALSEQMISYWSHFASTGDPNDAGHVHWPEFREGHEVALELGDRIQVRTTDSHHCAFWNRSQFVPNIDLR